MAYTFSEVRTRVAQITGRTDMEADGQISILVNKAQRRLDELLDRAATGTWFKNLTTGQYLVDVSGFRSIRRVWRMGADNSRVELDYLTPAELDTNYPKASEDLSEYSGAPAYWSVVTTRDLTSPSSTYKGDGFVSASWASLERLVVMPACDEAYTIAVEGVGYSPVLVADSATSWWTNNHFHTLVDMACAMLYASVGRDEDALRFERQAAAGIQAVDFAGVEEELRGQEPLVVRG